MVQPSSQHTDVMPLPYAVSVLHAYVCENQEIMDNFEFPMYIFEKKRISQVVNELVEPYALFFSCYIWNYEYNKALAKEIKQLYPQALIVFGGHNVPMDYIKALEELPFADYIIVGEGERPFEDLLLFFLGKKEKGNLHNIAYWNQNHQPVCNQWENYITDRIVSPYQHGLFDSIIEKYQNIYRFSATLETNRGCPFHCGYCDWGLNKARVRFASKSQVFQDIVWMSEHGIYECYGADSNFGMFESDLRFAQIFSECKAKTGYPKSFFVSFSKKSNERVLEIASVLKKAHMLQGATLSFQSLNPSTLTAIGRKNLDLTYFKKLMRQYHLRKIPTYSELILGLPMETEKSFKKGIGSLIECGQHSSIDVYECCVLPNSDMGQPKSIEKYGIVSQRLPFRRFDVKEDEEVQEYASIVVETSTMSKEAWKSCNLFFNIVTALHFKKLSQCIALYLHKEFQMSYDDIYMEILTDWRKSPGTVWAELIQKIEEQLDAISKGQDNWIFCWPEQKIQGDSFKNAIFKIVLRNYDAYLEQLRSVLKTFCIDTNFVQQLVRYQSFCIKTRIDQNLSRSEMFDYDFSVYFDALYLGEDAKLQKVKCKVTGKDIIHRIFCE